MSSRRRQPSTISSESSHERRLHHRRLVVRDRRVRLDGAGADRVRHFAVRASKKNAMNRSRIFLLVALGVAALAFAVIAGSGISKNLVYYWSPTDLTHAGDKAYGATIRLGGQVAPGSV